MVPVCAGGGDHNPPEGGVLKAAFLGVPRANRFISTVVFGNCFSFDGASEVRSRVRRGVLSLRVVVQMWT